MYNLEQRMKKPILVAAINSSPLELKVHADKSQRKIYTINFQINREFTLNYFTEKFSFEFLFMLNKKINRVG